MVKKISAIVLALVLCLTAMVVPVSAAESNDAKVTYEIKLDKEYYSAGDTVTVSLYMHFAEGLEWTAGTVFFGMSDVFVEATNADVDAVKASATFNDAYTSIYKTGMDCTWGWISTTTIVNNITSGSSEATYEKFLKLTVARSTAGSHENATNTKKGITSEELNADTAPYVTFQLTLADNLPDDTKIVIGIPSGSLNGSYSYMASLKSPGSATTTNKYKLADCDITKALAESIIGVEPCETHTWDNGVESTAPTCGAAGEMLYTCTVCKSTKTEAIAATGNHTGADAVEENYVAPSCSVAGSKDMVVYCSVCNAEMSRETVAVEATGEHVYATEVERVEPTCTTDGYYVMACGCGARDAQVTLPAAGHNYESVATAPTCTADGYTTYTCSVCGDTYTGDVVAANGHNYESVVTAPTCTEEGYTTFTCSVCGDTYTGDVVAANGHSYEEAVTAPTCTEAGYTTFTCACGDTYTGNEVDATGHNYEVAFVKNATCAKEGYTRYSCTACGDEYKETIPSKNHTNDDGSSALVEIPAVPATCKNTGYTAGTKCSICNSTVDVPQVVPTIDHTWDEGVVTEPTYTSEGYTTFTCTVCGETKKDNVVPKLEANYSVVIRQPSITKIRCKDTIVLHTEVEGGEGATVVWTADNENFVMTDLGDGKLEITSAEDGFTVFTATVYDANGVAVATDTVEMQSKADIWGKIGGFFRALFGSTLYYNY